MFYLHTLNFISLILTATEKKELYILMNKPLPLTQFTHVFATAPHYHQLINGKEIIYSVYLYIGD